MTLAGRNRLVIGAVVVAEAAGTGDSEPIIGSVMLLIKVGWRADRSDGSEKDARTVCRDRTDSAGSVYSDVCFQQPIRWAHVPPSAGEEAFSRDSCTIHRRIREETGFEAKLAGNAAVRTRHAKMTRCEGAGGVRCYGRMAS